MRRHTRFNASERWSGLPKSDGSIAVGCEHRAPTDFFVRKELRVAPVLLDEEGQVVLFSIGFDQVVAQLLHGAGDVEVVIDQIAGIDHHLVAPEHLEQVFRVVAAMPNPAIAEPLPPLDVHAVHARRGRGVQSAQLVDELRGQTLVGVEREDPVSFDRQLLERPPPLRRMGFERMIDDDGSVAFGNALVLSELPASTTKILVATGATLPRHDPRFASSSSVSTTTVMGQFAEARERFKKRTLS